MTAHAPDCPIERDAGEPGSRGLPCTCPVAAAARCLVCDGLLSHGGGARTVPSSAAWQALTPAGVPSSKAVHEACYEEWKLKALPHSCPKCAGAGKIATKTEEQKFCCHGGKARFPMGADWDVGCGWCPNLIIRQVPIAWASCSLSEGVGRLEKTPLAVTATVDWKRAP